MPQTATELTARDELRARQGPGARYDAPAAPHNDLLIARRGAAFFARKLNELTDFELDAESNRIGKTRRHIVSEISLHARAMAIAIKAVREGLSDEEADWLPDPAMTATLPARALRSLFAHSNIHLNVEFRDLTSEQWDATAKLNGQLRMRALPLIRGRDLWFGALDLNVGAMTSVLPEPLRTEVDRLGRTCRRTT